MYALDETRAHRNIGFYDDHLNNYYKGQLRADRDQYTSPQRIRMLKEGHLVEQAQERIYGKAEQDFKVDKKVLKKSAKKPLDFLEAEVARM